MRDKKRQMLLLHDINPKSFVFFFERGNTGRSWSIRDYSIPGPPREYRPPQFDWTADEIRQRAHAQFDAPTHHTHDTGFWHSHTLELNRRYIRAAGGDIAPAAAPPPPAPPAAGTFPVLNLPSLLQLPKSRKPQDMDRILHSPNSEDWVTWNFFQILRAQNPTGWWARVLSAARSRNPGLDFPFDPQSAPAARFWESVRAPLEYERRSRARMLFSDNPEWMARAKRPDPVEGPSEIDVVFEHDRFLVYAEAKLGSDISTGTTYDPDRNQILRNIDCLLANAGHRTPVFWMFVRDLAPDRAYVHWMNLYKTDPDRLARELPHRDPAQLRGIAANLTIILWSDLRELTGGPPVADAGQMAVRQELARRILE